ncbi:lipid phosphate phosphatase 2-like isoform X1 [Pistacia vera]|uniref:lipid phosphate phosphatase 2-like isoform X1 n=1 Tax=Pistacia vera TaxID=55513 RepID=UPI00126347F3|nr:lipid phosphate phosphatase 2-like isoform X1 [Pistacia vera]
MAWLPNFRSFFLGGGGGMREIDLGSHTIRSHGSRVAKTHMHDWIILVVLGVTDIILNLIHPFYRFVGKDMMADFKYPMKDNTVPVWAVPIYAVLMPILIFLIIYSRRRCVYDLHHGILGLLYAVLITGVITDAIKVATGRPRPNFFWRCFPDGIENFGGRFGDVLCHGKESEIKEGHKSFPSGHTSWSFAGLGFLSVYLSGKIKAFDQRGHVAKLCLVLLPLLLAALVAVSRVSDYWHHWQDVFAGGIIGLVVASICYLQFFPPPYHDEGWGPYAYFRAREESNSNGSTVLPVNGLAIRSRENVVNQNGNSFMPLHVESPSRTTIDAMEAGRR